MAEGLLRVEQGRGTFVVDRPEAILGEVVVARDDDRAPRDAGVPKALAIGVIAERRREPQNTADNQNRILDGMEAAANATGATVKVLGSLLSETGLRRSPSDIVDEIRASRVDAVVAIYWSESDRDFMLSDPALRESLTALIGWSTDVRAVNSVYYDSVDAGFQATLHLISRGCKRVVFFSPFVAAWVLKRLEGSAAAASHAGRDAVSLTEAVSHEELNAKSRRLRIPLVDMAYLAAKDVLPELGQFDGVVASNDQVAIGFRRAGQEAGLIDGEHYALIGFDDEPDSREQSLSTMRPPFEGLGAEAVALALRTVSGGLPARICLQSRVVARQSTMGITREPQTRVGA
jgi:LacI family transcriptional regulator